MRPSRAFAHLLIVALLILAPAAASQAPETPEQVAQHYLRAMSAQQWDTMAALMHPAALRQLRSLLAPLFESPTMDGSREELLGVHSLSEAKTLSDRAVFATFMGRLLQSQEQVMGILRDSRIQVIGHVPEGTDTVHVVYRMNYEKDDAAVSKMDVFSMQRMGDAWRGLLAGDFRMLGAMLRRHAGS